MSYDILVVRSVVRAATLSTFNTQDLHSSPSTRTVPINADPGPRSPRIPLSPTLPNGFISKEHREAALRERGLRPPRKDLSQQEREADERLGSIPSPSSSIDVNDPSEAERLKATWIAKNRSSDSANSDLAPSATPHLEDTETRPPSTPPSALSEIDVRHYPARAGHLPWVDLLFPVLSLVSLFRSQGSARRPRNKHQSPLPWYRQPTYS